MAKIQRNERVRERESLMYTRTNGAEVDDDDNDDDNSGRKAVEADERESEQERDWQVVTSKFELDRASKRVRLRASERLRPVVATARAALFNTTHKRAACLHG